MNGENHDVKKEENEEEKAVTEMANMIIGLTKMAIDFNNEKVTVEEENSIEEERRHFRGDIALHSLLTSSLVAQLYVDLQTGRPSGFEISLGFKDFYMGLIYNRGKCKTRTSTASVIDEKDVKTEICLTIFDYLKRHRKLTVLDYFT